MRNKNTDQGPKRDYVYYDKETGLCSLLTDALKPMSDALAEASNKNFASERHGYRLATPVDRIRRTLKGELQRDLDTRRRGLYRIRVESNYGTNGQDKMMPAIILSVVLPRTGSLDPLPRDVCPLFDEQGQRIPLSQVGQSARYELVETIIESEDMSRRQQDTPTKKATGKAPGQKRSRGKQKAA